MKNLLLLLAVAFFPACCVSNSAKHPQGHLNLAEHLERQTVAMVTWVVPDEDGDPKEVEPDTDGARLQAYCSGVWIDEDTFITAEHCVDRLGKPPERRLLEQLLPPELAEELPPWDPVNQPALYSSFGDIGDYENRSDRSFHEARVLAVNKTEDLALVRAVTSSWDEDIPEHEIATLAGDAHVGDDVHIVGQTAGMWWTYQKGVVSQIRVNIDNADGHPVNALQVSSPMWFGNSGGGGFDSKGRLLGIADWIRGKVPNVGFLVRYDVVSNFIRANYQ